MDFTPRAVKASCIDQDLADEIDLLLKFPDSSMEGLKIHHGADRSLVEAAGRLFAKGLITQKDGGYLTDAGREAAQSAALLLGLMCPAE